MNSELRKVLVKWAIALVIGIVIAVETKQIGFAYLGASIIFGFSYMIGGFKNIGWLGAIIDIFSGGGPILTAMGMILGFFIGSFVGPFIGIYELIMALAGNDWSEAKARKPKRKPAKVSEAHDEQPVEKPEKDKSDFRTMPKKPTSSTVHHSTPSPAKAKDDWFSSAGDL